MPHEDAVAEAPDPAQIGVELQLQRAPEHVETGCVLDRVESGEAFERRLHLVGSLALLLRPRAATGLGSEVVAHEPFGPTGELAPTAARLDGQLAHEVGDEFLERTRGYELTLVVLGARLAIGNRPLLRDRPLEGPGMALEALVPLPRAADDARGAAGALPPCRGDALARVEHRRRGQQTHHVVAVEVAVGQREQSEERAAEHALGERADRGAVVGDPRSVELFVHEPCVGLGRSVENGHALQRHAVAQRAEHRAHDGAHLVVGIRHRHDAGAVHRHGRRAARSSAEPQARE